MGTPAIHNQGDAAGKGAGNAQRGFCVRCGDANPYTALVCSGCGARLPWATAVRPGQAAAPTATPALAPHANNVNRAGTSNVAQTRGQVVTLAPGQVAPPLPLPNAAPSPSLPQTGPLTSSGHSNGAATGSAYGVGAMPAATGGTPTNVALTGVVPTGGAAVHMWVGPEAREIEALPHCVVCGSSSVQRVTKLCGPDQWPSSANASPGHGHRWQGGRVPAVDAGAGTDAVRNAQLARALAPPEIPAYEHHNTVWGALALAVVGVGALPFTSMLHAAWPEIATGINVLLFGGAQLLFFMYLADVQRARKSYATQHAIWQRQVKKWADLIYCERCDNVFDPHTHAAARVRHLSSLL